MLLFWLLRVVDLKFGGLWIVEDVLLVNKKFDLITLLNNEFDLITLQLLFLKLLYLLSFLLLI